MTAGGDAQRSAPSGDGLTASEYVAIARWPDVLCWHDASHDNGVPQLH